MKTTIGGDRLGSGNKQEISLRNYERSTHDLSSLWRSSMAAGTLVPFMHLVGLPGDTFDIDLEADVLTLPTVGPLFGSFKVQLDVFQVPIRLYNANLHMNKLGIGMDMGKVFLPQIELTAKNKVGTQPTLMTTTSPQSDDVNLKNDAQINPSSILSYLGIRGIGTLGLDGTAAEAKREFNAIKLLAYWEIYKNYYANKQEENGWVIHYDGRAEQQAQRIRHTSIEVNPAWNNPTGEQNLDINDVTISVRFETTLGTTMPDADLILRIYLYKGNNPVEPDWTKLRIQLQKPGEAIGTAYSLPEIFRSYEWDEENAVLTVYGRTEDYEQGDNIFNWYNEEQFYAEPAEYGQVPQLVPFPLKNIDDLRLEILRKTEESPYVLTHLSKRPYGLLDAVGRSDSGIDYYSKEFPQEGLGLKTYQSDLFNNWIDTEWIDGTNGVNEVTAVSTAGDSFTIDALNLSQKVYNMLNRIAISGGTYDDWLDAVYTHERHRGTENPVYMGSLIKELAFEEVISNAEAGEGGNEQPLGTLAGRGRLTQKNKGGKIKIKVDEPSYIMGIVSLTPRIDYSQGNTWDNNLKTMNDFHKPALDAIGYQDLITEQMAWQSTTVTWDETNGTQLVQRSAGKQPAWINYMTAVNETFGNFALENKEMFMTLNRRYEINVDTEDANLAVGQIIDLTTYIDPSKYNHIFAQTSLDAQNFWVQISKDITARRKMSAKVIPNL